MYCTNKLIAILLVFVNISRLQFYRKQTAFRRESQSKTEDKTFLIIA